MTSAPSPAPAPTPGSIPPPTPSSSDSPAGVPFLQPGPILQPGAGPSQSAPTASPNSAGPLPQDAPLTPGARWSILTAITLTIAVADLWTKQWAFNLLKEDGESVLAWEGILRWTRHMNTGVVWGMGQGNNHVFTWISALAIPVVLFIFSKMKHPRTVEVVGLALILGGTIGNLYDRVMFDAVRDFIHVIVINWPVFNVADAAICTGAGLVAIGLLRAPQPSTHD